MKPLSSIFTPKILAISFSLVVASNAQANDNSPIFDFDKLEVVSSKKINKAPAISSKDPYESFNRDMLTFNLAFHDSVGKPMIRAYRAIPSPIRTGGENFLNNLSQPLSMLNSLLQGNIEDGLSTLMRFTMNTTFGLLGVLEVADEAGLEDKNEDFGQTLYVWGVWDEANYVVLPFFGPTTTRDLFGKIEGTVDPIYHQQGLQSIYNLESEEADRAILFIANGVTQYNRAEPLIGTLEQQLDPYLFAREAYIQSRTSAIYNGKPPLPKIEDDFLFE